MEGKRIQMGQDKTTGITEREIKRKGSESDSSEAAGLICS